MARLHAGYKSSAAAARAFGWAPERYKSHENGGRGIKRPDLISYARAYRVDPEWLAFGRNPPKWLAAAPPKNATLHVLSTTVFPEIDWSQIATYCNLLPNVGSVPVLGERELDVSIAKASDGVFFVKIRDRSMFSTAGGVSFDIGDVIACNPSASAEPGDFVIAIPDLGSRDPVLRRLQMTGIAATAAVYSLVPLNPDYPTLQISGAGPGKILARVIASTRHF